MKNNICLLFLSSILTFSMCTAYTSTKTYYYRDGYSLALVQNGISSFLNMIKKTDSLTYASTINDVMYDAPLNNINVPCLLKNLMDALTKRINRIERLQGKTIDPFDLGCGAGSIGIGATLIGTLYYFYKKYQVGNNNRFNELKKSLENKGFGVVIVGNSITIVTPSPTPLLSVEDMKESQELFELYQKQKNFGAYSFFAGLAALCSTLYGILKLNEGLYPHYDDAYLKNYKDFLIITEYIECQKLFNN